MRLVLLSATLAVLCAAAIVPYRVPAQSNDLIARGQYLVEKAGKCGDCHGTTLHGAALTFLNPKLPPIVQRSTPKIAGLPQLANRAAVTFLQTGKLPNGKGARPPMPQYRFDVADATAIVAYLKSLR